MSHPCPCDCTSSSSSVQSAGTGVTNSAYSTLNQVPTLRILGVVTDTTTQAFLAGKDSGGMLFRGFVFSEDGVNFKVSKAPEITLPLVNAKVGDAYPATGDFDMLMVGAGETNSAWKMFAAPTTGEYFLRAKDGKLAFAQAEEVPGIATIAAQTTFVNQGNLLVPYTPGDGPVTLRKLLPVHERVVIGWQELDGTRYFKSLADDKALTHPIIRGTKTIAGTYEQVMTGTTIIETGGIALLDSSEAAEDDAVPAWYSPSRRRFYRSLPRTIEVLASDAAIVVPDNGAWQSMTPHAVLSNIDVNGRALFVSLTLRVSMTGSTPNYDMDLGIFIDNALVHTWNVKGAKDNTVLHIVENLDIGKHTVEVRVNKAVSSGSFTIVNSSFNIFSL